MPRVSWDGFEHMNWEVLSSWKKYKNPRKIRIGQTLPTPKSFFLKHVQQQRTTQKKNISTKKKNPSWGLTHPPISEFFSDFLTWQNLLKSTIKRRLTRPPFTERVKVILNQVTSILDDQLKRIHMRPQHQQEHTWRRWSVKNDHEPPSIGDPRFVYIWL